MLEKVWNKVKISSLNLSEIHTPPPWEIDHGFLDGDDHHNQVDIENKL